MVLGVSCDTIEENAAFARKFGFPFPLLCDTGRVLGMAYGACDDPTSGSAKRISYIIGPEGAIEHAFPKVDAKTHPSEVLKLLP